MYASSVERNALSNMQSWFYRIISHLLAVPTDDVRFIGLNKSLFSDVVYEELHRLRRSFICVGWRYVTSIFRPYSLPRPRLCLYLDIQCRCHRNFLSLSLLCRKSPFLCDLSEPCLVYLLHVSLPCIKYPTILVMLWRSYVRVSNDTA